MSRRPLSTYRRGLYLLLSCVFLLFAPSTTDFGCFFDEQPKLFALHAVQLVLIACLGVSTLTIPRRPDVFYDGHLVDRQFTASALRRFTWSWATGLLTLAVKKNNLDMHDLPRPGHSVRTADVTAAWNRQGYSLRPLWIALILAHRRAFSLQWSLTLLQSVLNLAPQWVILQLLRLLERRRLEPLGVGVWAWVFWLGLALVMQAVSSTLAYRRPTMLCALSMLGDQSPIRTS